MEAVNQAKEPTSKGTGVFDQMDKMPDISLKELYYVLKASRRKLKQKFQNGNIEQKLSSL